MNNSLKNKVVVVTGAADGIGLEIVDKYLEEGAKIAVVLDINETAGNDAVKTLEQKYGEGKSEFIKCDVTSDLDTVSRGIIDKYDSVDVLVLNAGIANSLVPRRMIDILLTSVIEWSLKFSEFMGKDKGGNGGTILINSSIFGFRTTPFAPVYQASKFAVLGFAKSLGHVYNFNKTGVRVVAICPGFTETKLTLSLRDPDLKKTLDKDVAGMADALPWQKAEAVGKAAVEIFERAESGSAWIIEGGELTELV